MSLESELFRKGDNFMNSPNTGFRHVSQGGRGRAHGSPHAWGFLHVPAVLHPSIASTDVGLLLFWGFFWRFR